MAKKTKGLRCPCGHEQNVEVEEFILNALCPKCGRLVALGETLGLSFWEAAGLVGLLWLFFG
jgi:hypothetical protein